MTRPSPFPPRPLAMAAILLTLAIGSAYAQTAPSGTASPTAAPGGSSLGTMPGTASPRAPLSVAPGSGNSTPPAGAPSPAGLSSASPFPPQLPSPMPFPAGIPSSTIAAPGTSAAGSGAPGGGASGNAGAPGAVGNVIGSGSDGRTRAFPRTGEADLGSNGANNTAVMGGAGAATLGSPTAAAPTTALQVLQSFQQADMNRDGLVSRAEAQRLALPQSFEELDGNKDGMLSRGEYEDAFRR